MDSTKEKFADYALATVFGLVATIAALEYFSILIPK